MIYKVMRYHQNIYPSSTEFFGICFVNTKDGSMLYGHQIVNILTALANGEATAFKDNLGFYIEWDE